MKRQKIRAITMILGLLLAVVVICSHVFQITPVKQSGKVAAEQKTEQSEENFSYVSAPTITPPSSANVQQNLVAHCLFEIVQPEEEKESFITEFSLHPQKFLLTLFRVIISPNAP
jgi:hypothetical protein